MDIRIIKPWEQIVDVGDEEMSPTGPFSKWECVTHHPIERRRYTVDLKKLMTHWRMRVFYKNIRTGHRFMKAIFPSNPDDAKEAQFIAMKHLNRYFEEQLALYNAICIIHIGRKHTEGCDCDDHDHSQHLDEWQQPLEPYDTTGFPPREAVVNEEGELCGMCVGKVDIEAYIKYDVCPYCRTQLPKTVEEYYELEKQRGTDYYAEFRKKQTKGFVNPASTET